MARRLGPLSGALILVAAACGHDGRVLVVVDTDFDAPGELDRVTAIVRRNDLTQEHTFAIAGRAGASSEDRSLLVPLSFVVAARDGSGDFDLVVEGYDTRRPEGSSLLVSRRAVTGFIPDRTLVLPMPLLRSCRDVVCEPMQTCTELGCVDARVDPSTLAPIADPGQELLRDAGPTRDAGPSCRTFGPWGAPQRATGLPASACCVSLSADNRTIYFNDSLAAYRVFQAERVDMTPAFGTATEVLFDGVSLDGSTEPSTSSDDRLLYVSRTTAAPTQVLFVAERGAGGAFGALRPVEGIPEVGDLLSADPNGDARAIALSVGDPYGVISTATRPNATAPFGPLLTQDALRNADRGGFPSLSSDGLTIWFHRRMPGDPTEDVHVATRTSIDALFGEPAAVPGASDDAINEHDPEVTFDGRELWFSREGMGLYYLTRDCLDP